VTMTRGTSGLLVTLALTTLVALGAATAQPSTKVPRIGLLVYGNPPPAPSPEQQVIEGLRELGWVDGQNMRLVIRPAEGRPERLPDLTRELVESSVDLIVGVGTDVAQVVRSVTGTMPLVMSVSEDPSRSGWSPASAAQAGT
jgi:putative tryptophan/tyrosine transport system substrate-binding protein